MSKISFTKITSKLKEAALNFKYYVMLAVLLGLADADRVNAQCYTITKSILGVSAATSGVQGNIDVTYQIIVINTLCPIAPGINVHDALSDPANLGSAFVGLVGIPSIVYVSPTSFSGSINPSYTGISPNIDILDGTGFLLQNDTLILNITAEVNVDAVGAPADLNNQATATQLLNTGIDSSNTVAIPDCWTNCQLACNNNVQISVNSICEAEILSSMILEGEDEICASLGFYEVNIYYNNKKVILPLDQSYIGKKLRVSIRNIVCNNSCWGTILLEDKTPPALNCLPERIVLDCNEDISPAAIGFPVDSNLVDQTTYPYVVSGIDACGTVLLTYSDSIVRYDCSHDSLSTTIYRKWCATDPGGFKACCYDTIDLKRGTIADITLPPHYDGQPGNEDILLCDGDWTKLPNGFPDTTDTGTGMPQGTFCGNIQFDFQDDTIRVCKGSYKLFRRWLIIDWCRPTDRLEYLQLIKVVDTIPPTVFNCPVQYEINTNPWNCSASFIVPAPENYIDSIFTKPNTPYVYENCSNWSYYITSLPALSSTLCEFDPTAVGDTKYVLRLKNGRYQLTNLPLGCHWVTYHIVDDCGNETTCTFTIRVVDNTPPVAVCHQKTVISLGSNGLASVPASVFNDGSHDNCGQVTFAVRRMFADTSGDCGSTRFKESQIFCCADVSSSIPPIPVRVVLRVFDAAGNSSDCMVDAIIQDKLPPVVKFCPKDTTVNCNTDLRNLGIYGTATGTDNCSPLNISVLERNELNSCGIGNIFRDFILKDRGGLITTCTQIIHVIDTTPFKGSDITWPRDTVIFGCTNSISIDSTGKPKFKNQDRCNQVIYTHEDLTFNYVENVCFKILRKWTVIDWCTYSPSDSIPKGVWYHTQVIKINNKVAPTITSSCSNRDLCITEDCSVFTTLEASAIDDCTHQEDLRWTYAIDLNNNGTVDTTNKRSRISFIFQKGIHKITWTVEDQCGNKTTCSYLLNVKDCKRPTPYCLTGITTVIMPSNGQVTIWAKDYNLNSEDNCTSKGKLKFSFSPDVRDSFKTIYCSDLLNGKSGTFNVNIYVTDEEGNQDFCKTILIVQDNQDVCPDAGSITKATIFGIIKSSNNLAAPNVEVTLLKDNLGFVEQKTTGSIGEYAFANIEMHENYKLRPHFDSDPLRGVSTKDIVLIQKHILGLESLVNPYKMIAADVNKSKSITARDISELRKLILGINNAFPQNNSWNFVPEAFQLDVDYPFDYPSEINMLDIDKDMDKNDFIAVKTGDVTGDASTQLSSGAKGRSNHTIHLMIDEKNLTMGNTYEIPLFISETITQLEGLQFSLTVDPELVEIIQIISGQLLIESSNYNLQFAGNGTIAFSWNASLPMELKSGSHLISLVIQAKTDHSFDHSVIEINSLAMNSEVYLKGEDANLKMQFRNGNVGEASEFSTYKLYQNIPNPFNAKTIINYSLPSQEDVKLSVYELSGKVLFQNELKGRKGMNSVEISIEPSYTGILYYQLEAKEFSATRKMVVIK
ncbi:MAG: T9SS type A sorting domain-containing protein [Bacteroidota bacterium]|nr:T9SS type A sorting domain-containing protein [Bacteroidota bacterium]